MVKCESNTVEFEDAPMIRQKKMLAICALLLMSAGSAWAGGWRGHGSVGIYIGPGGYWRAPIYRPYYFPAPYLYADPFYAPAPVIIERAPPPVYIEQGQVAVEPALETTNYWHYCPEAKGYYPYIKECPGGWQKVLPQPAK